LIIPIICLIDKLETDEQKITANDICEKYTDQMISYAMKFFYNKQDAEDVVQDALVRVIKNIEKFIGKPEYEIKALLRMYTKNVAITRYNKLKKEGLIQYIDELEHLDSDDTYKYDTCRIDAIDETLESNNNFDSDVNVLWKYVRNLKDLDQQIIIYRFHYNYTVREISKELQIPESTVSTKLNRALKKIRKILEEKKL